MTARHGSCACDCVCLVVAGDLPAADACHCVTCRKTSGHFFVSTDVPRSALTVGGSDHLRWYASSERVRRGFCGECGSTLFWDAPGKSWIGVAMGAFDDPTGTRIGLHVHVAGKGDYYAIADGAPQHATVPGARHA